MLQCLQEPFARSLRTYRLHNTASPFIRRVTCLDWHPTHPTTVAVGSKGGDIILWDFDALNRTTFIQGVGRIKMRGHRLNVHIAPLTTFACRLFVCTQKGAGDFIGEMKFCPTDVSKVYVASGDGTLTVQSFEGLPSQTLSRTPDCIHSHHDLW